jgi:hypothetical protein
MDRISERITALNHQATQAKTRDEALVILTEVQLLDAIRRAKRYV